MKLLARRKRFGEVGGDPGKWKRRVTQTRRYLLVVTVPLTLTESSAGAYRTRLALPSAALLSDSIS